jgi:hypothetical protein
VTFRILAAGGRLRRHDLYKLVKKRRLPASEILQKALRTELRRLDLLAEGDRYLTDLIAEVGDPTPDELARVAEPAGMVLTSDPDDLEALVQHAHGVIVKRT